MNRKHNPWVALVALILLATFLVMTYTGCSASPAEAEAEPPARFTCEQVGEAKGVDLYLITDTETGAQYLLAENYGHGYGIGLTKLEG